MLTTPVFRPWRPIWDKKLGHITCRLDELAIKRQKGRSTPPRVTDWADVSRILHALQVSGGMVSSSRFIQEKVEPLLKACVWPRWLLLEEALEQAASSGDLHMSALVLRSQIEELDALRIASAVMLYGQTDSWDGASMTEAISTLTQRLLPRLQAKPDHQLVEEAPNTAIISSRPEDLQRAFDLLSEYVHPNYGSHILSVKPQSFEAANVFIEAFVSIYEAFFLLPWADDGGDGDGDLAPSRQKDLNDSFLTLADQTVPRLKTAFPDIGEEKWAHVVAHLRECADSENNWASLKHIDTDVEAISALRLQSVPLDSWPHAFATDAGQNRYAILIQQERKLTQDAAKLSPANAPEGYEQRLSLLASGLSFSINLTEYKLDLLARQAAYFLNKANVLGAALAVRSLLELHAIAVTLSDKLQSLWERAERSAPNTPKVAAALAEAEKQIARVLAGSSQPSEALSEWRLLWEEVARKPYNVLDPIRAVDNKQAGFAQIYGFLSHINHGTICTGGDLLGTGKEGWKSDQSHLSAQLTYFLANVCHFEAMMERQAALMLTAKRVNVARSSSQPTDRIQQMRVLPGQKLKHGRDIFGAGTREDPYRFRSGLLYHDAYYKYLTQEGIQVNTKTLERFDGGIGDRIQTEGGRFIYFLNNKLPRT